MTTEAPVVYTATIPGNPVPKARARVGRGGGRTPERTKAFERTIGWTLKLAWRQEADGVSLFGVRCRFVFSRTLDDAERHVDGDNCLKSVLDGGNFVIWQDDSQVRCAHYDVEFGGEPRTEVSFWTLTC